MSNKYILTIPHTSVMNANEEIDLREFRNFVVNTTVSKESNDFLNSLYSIFDKEIKPIKSENCPWFFTPQRKTIKQTKYTYFGSMRTRYGYTHIAISYKKKGAINNIWFKPFEISITDKEFYSVIKGIVKKAKATMNEKRFYLVSAKLKGSYPGREDVYELHDYVHNTFKIEDSILSFVVDSHDEIEAEFIAKQRVVKIVNFLAVESNIFFEFYDLAVDIEVESSEFNISKPKSVFQNDIDNEFLGYIEGRFIDFIPEFEGRIILSSESIQLISSLLVSDSEQLRVLNNASYHFREGLKRERDLVNRRIMVFSDRYLQVSPRDDNERQSIIDISVTHYLSAIETVTLLNSNPEKCEHCGQPMFKINQRVSNFISQYLWPHYSVVFKKIYNMRSIYLHTGTPYASNCTLNTRPLVSEFTGTGSTDLNLISVEVEGASIHFGVENIREWTSYAIRNFYKDSGHFELPD